MSIKEHIEYLEAEGKLVSIHPYLHHTTHRRKLYMTKELYDEIYKERIDDPEEELFSALMADIDTYVTFSEIDFEYFKCLEPKNDGIWEIRSKRPIPQVRIFGMFADIDIFIATNLQFRDVLGVKSSQQWKIEMRVSRTKWMNLFNGYQYKKSTNIKNLVTGVLDEPI